MGKSMGKVPSAQIRRKKQHPPPLALPRTNPETQEDRELLRRIVDYGVKIGVQFRTEPAGSPELAGSNFRFIRRLRQTLKRVRQIRVHRETGGLWADNRDILKFLAGSTAPLSEAIGIAHELGHDQLNTNSADADACADRREQVEAQVQRQERIKTNEADFFYSEEYRAWTRGRSILKGQVNFQKWGEFNRNRRSSLKTYEDGIRRCCPGWEPRKRYR